MTFNYPVVVFVDTILLIDTGEETTSGEAVYLSGNGTAAVTFLYTVAEGDRSVDLGTFAGGEVEEGGGLIGTVLRNSDHPTQVRALVKRHPRAFGHDGWRDEVGRTTAVLTVDWLLWPTWFTLMTARTLLGYTGCEGHGLVVLGTLKNPNQKRSGSQALLLVLWVMYVRLFFSLDDLCIQMMTPVSKSRAGFSWSAPLLMALNIMLRRDETTTCTFTGDNFMGHRIATAHPKQEKRQR